MRRTLLLLLSFLSCVAWGQTYRYRYWIDDKVSSAVSGSATGEKELTVNIASLNNGFHAIHVQGRNSSGVWSSVRTRFFLKETEDVSTARYWIDNDMNTLHNGVATSGVIDLDIASLKAGLHTVHYQTFNTKGDASAVRTLCFLMTEQSTATTARYWIDNDANTLHEGVATSGIIDIDISKLGVGMHVVHYQTFNAKGDASAVHTKHFFVDQVQIGTLTASIAIDDGEGTGYALSEDDIEIDISELADGRHELNVTLIDGGGSPVGQKVKEFIVGDTRDVQTLELTAIPEMTYGAEAYTLPQATAEGLDLTWSIDDDAVASINGNVLTVVGAGTAIVTATQDGNESYQPFSREFTLTVNKAMLTITANNCTKQEGDATPELTVRYDGFVYDDDASSLTTQPIVTTTATLDSPVGTYPITVSGAESGNYEFTYVDGILTITEKPVIPPSRLYVEEISLRCGSQAVIPVLFENEGEYGGLQCEVTLPAGITLSKVTKTNRLSDDFTLQKSKSGDNTYQILLYNTSRLSFTGNDGALFTMTVDVDDNMAEGDYAMTFTDIVASGIDESQEDQADFSVPIHVEKYLVGDANRDNRVNVTDIMAVANYILKNPSSNFNAKAADVNNDNRINVTDIMGIANIILKVNPAQSAPRIQTLDPQ